MHLKVDRLAGFDVEIEGFAEFVKEPLPEPEWLIDGLFERDSQTILFGPSGEGKSFIALSWAIAIAAGLPWLGEYGVKQGPVVYAVGEGRRGMQRRAAAAARALGLTSVPDLHFYPAAPQLRSPEGLKKFLAKLKKIQPVLVIIDTLARSFVGGDENAAKDMGEWIHAAAAIQRETGACVMPIHHTPKSRKSGTIPTERGNGALRGAMDTSIGVSMGDGVITLTNFKQKDDVQFAPLVVGTKVWILREATPEKPAMTSLVVVPFEESLPGVLHELPRTAVAVLQGAGKPLTKTEWWDLTKAFQRDHGQKEPAKSTFFRWVERLEKDGEVKETSAGFVVVGV